MRRLRVTCIFSLKGTYLKNAERFEQFITLGIPTVYTCVMYFELVNTFFPNQIL